ncbi:aminodeoxychorismate synthase [Thozetella sp. PMI_491]|nr:aminodeoxychorismate synthase [Thozetella sp. PMI_491]
MAATAGRHRILFLDAYDSFSNNITSLLTTLLDVDVFVLPIDSPLPDPSLPGFAEAFRKELAHYDAVVCGPGPGSPENGADVGLMEHVWRLGEEDLLPVLGVCLGFQSMVADSGGRVRRLQKGLHGMVRDILHAREIEGGIFSGVGRFQATLYHSLCIDIGQDQIPMDEWPVARWTASPAYPHVVPLAWIEERREEGAERILMAARHAVKPFWGVQYHPESVCTEEEGNKVISNWFREAVLWNRLHGRTPLPGRDILARNARKPSLLAQLSPQHRAQSWWQTWGVDSLYESKKIPLPTHIQITHVLEILQSGAKEDCIVLDSSNAAASAFAKADVRGRYSIMALEATEALNIEYHAGDNYVSLKLAGEKRNDMPLRLEKVTLGHFKDIWGFLAHFQHARRLEVDPRHDHTPFLGGFMGYITYEQGLYDIGVPLRNARGHHRPDVCLAWVTKSAVIDHTNRVLYIQHLRQPAKEKKESWVERTAARLVASPVWRNGWGTESHTLRKAPASPRLRRLSKSSIQTPQTAEYEKKVQLCQEFIAAGESYELCLTDQTRIARSRGIESHHGGFETSYQKSSQLPSMAGRGSWDLFKSLRSRQPAPFASYLRLGGATLVSASPERFLQFDQDGLCSMRPMKGTVRKSDAVSTLEEAEKILHVPKEEAENLMIVDLVRHDLHGICGAGNVSVPHLLKVEEYQSVFQMITVVEGRLPRPEGAEVETEYGGLDVLAASLPPGSMTGAPKKRSCELLQQIEDGKERSLYSGVVGYMCVTGAGDWSVTIRSMFRWDDEQAGASDGGEKEQEVWHIGAGGAVTILSTPQGEREEMFTKLAGPLGVFGESG